MNTPWLKTTIFWTIVIGAVFIVFQCTQKSESNKAAPTLMYERLYHCTIELDKQKNQALIQKIQSTVQHDLKQQELMQLLNECRKANPLKSNESYVSAIKNWK